MKTRALLASVVDARVPHVIFSSTAATYGIPEESPVREDTPRRPINPYGTSKLMTELMLADIAAAHAVNYCALRYFNVAGADPQGRTGQSTAGATHLIKVAVEAALGKRDSVSVFGADYHRPLSTTTTTLPFPPAKLSQAWSSRGRARRQPAAPVATLRWRSCRAHKPSR